MNTLKRILALALVGQIMLCSNAGAQKKMKEAVVWPSDNVKWTEMKGGAPGIMYADLWGHIEKGAYGSLVQLPAGLKNPLHSHSNDVKLIVISGTFLYTPQGGTEQRLGPGSYLMVPGHLKHESGTGDEGPCKVFQESSGKFDFVPAGPMKK